MATCLVKNNKKRGIFLFLILVLCSGVSSGWSLFSPPIPPQVIFNLSAFNSTGSSGNSSWNQSLADTLYYPINNPYNFVNESESKWNESSNFLYPINRSRVVGIGTDNPSAFYDMEIRNDDGRNQGGEFTNNTILTISSGAGNANASIYFREYNVVRYFIGYDSLNSIFKIYNFGVNKDAITFDTDGFGNQITSIYGNLFVEENISAKNICYSNGSNCQISSGVNLSFNQSLTDSLYAPITEPIAVSQGNWSAVQNNYYNKSQLYNTSEINNTFVPYIGATKDVNIGDHNLSLNRSILFGESSGIKELWRMNNAGGDGFRTEYWYDFELANDDWLVFHKTDGNDPTPDGGIAFMMGNASGDNRTILKLDGYGNANFTDYNILTSENITSYYLFVTGLFISGVDIFSIFLNQTDQRYNDTLNIESRGNWSNDKPYYWNTSTNANVTTNITASNFFGIYDWISGDSYTNFNGTILVTNETKINETIDAKLVTITYLPTSFNISRGLGSGNNNLGALGNVSGSSLFNITEVAGSNPAVLYVNFSGISVSGINELIVKFQYTGTHYYDVDLWDYDSSYWETYATLSPGPVKERKEISVSSSHVLSGLAQIRVIHPSNGINGQVLEIALNLANQHGGSSETDTSSFLKVDGSRNLTADWEVGNKSIKGIYNISSIYSDSNSTWRHQSYPSPCATGFISGLGDNNICNDESDPIWATEKINYWNTSTSANAHMNNITNITGTYYSNASGDNVWRKYVNGSNAFIIEFIG
jgi:hypothetical protein